MNSQVQPAQTAPDYKGHEIGLEVKWKSFEARLSERGLKTLVVGTTTVVALLTVAANNPSVIKIFSGFFTKH